MSKLITFRSTKGNAKGNVWGEVSITFYRCKHECERSSVLTNINMKAKAKRYFRGIADPRCGSAPNWFLVGCIWRTLPSSHSPSLPLFPPPPFPLFLRGSGLGRLRLVWRSGPRAQGSGKGAPSKQHLGPDPHRGVRKKFHTHSEIPEPIKISYWHFHPPL